ncbi:MAG: hypothetical protein DRQ64_00310 [Gammaproteobacteria bacterium]|nr:MAG: hypothetical protein DRQ64_00310 [Gammaproteobacteria bacterium]
MTHKEFKLLDHGYVKLVDHMGSDLAPLEAARMSTDSATGVDEDKDDRLRTRLWGDKHTSPFEMNEVVFEIQCPMFVLRQLDRHRTATIDNSSAYFENYDEFRKYTNRNEFSGRYSKMPDLYYIPPVERIRAKSKANKQGSAEPLELEAQQMVCNVIETTTAVIRQAYETIVEEGVATEIARLPLPQNQYTKIRIKASLLHWLKFFDLRLRGDVQEETRSYAQAMAWVVRGLWPKCWDVFEEHNLYGAQLSRRDRQVVHEWIVAMDVYHEDSDRTADAPMDVFRLAAQGFGYNKRQREDLLRKLEGPEDDLMTLTSCVSFIDVE